MIMILFTALPSYGGVPGGRGSQWEAAAGGDSPGAGGGHAEWPAPPGPGELPGCPAGGPPQGKHHVATSVLSAPLHVHIFPLTADAAEVSPSVPYTAAVANLAFCRKTLCQLTIDHEENWFLQLNARPRMPHEHKVNHIWTHGYNPCVMFFFLNEIPLI